MQYYLLIIRYSLTLMQLNCCLKCFLLIDLKWISGAAMLQVRVIELIDVF